MANSKAMLMMALRKYGRHLRSCLLGTITCTCGHATNQHFKYTESCAHCQCKKFDQGKCTCGLSELLK